MKKIFILNAHWNNRGDEAANLALIDELTLDENNYISLQINSNVLYETEKLKQQGIKVLNSRFPKMRDTIEILLMYISKGKICISSQGKEFMNALKSADIVVHAPGGPSIGDIYIKSEIPYLYRLFLARRLGKKYFFYAPSMGPFINKKRNLFRKKILKDACGITLRESISLGYLKQLLPEAKCEVTLDSAFQHPVEMLKNVALYEEYEELKEFLKYHKKVIGITITDLQWNPLYSGNKVIKENIRKTFTVFINDLNKKGYGVVFIPQLFGAANDYSYMKSFSTEKTYVMADTYDSYFQQFAISKMEAVVGMRYHSNIFSCKMCVPFISISYEQKMKGFMKKINCDKYCIDIENLSGETLINIFDNMMLDYDNYKKLLVNINPLLINEAKRTTEILLSMF